MDDVIAKNNDHDSEYQISNVQHLERCVHDLIGQNKTLVDVVIELEAETGNRVKAAETFLERTAKSAKAYMVALSDHEQYVHNLVKNSSKVHSTIKKLHDKISILEDENVALQEKNANLSHDIKSLVHLIEHARNTGQWDVGNIDFCEVSFEDVFGSVGQFSERTSLEELDNIDSVSGILSNGNVGEDYLSRTLSVRSHGSSVRTAGSKEVRLTRYDAQIHRLQGELHHANQNVADLHAQLSDRDRTISKLQVEISDLNHDITMKEKIFDVHRRTCGPSTASSQTTARQTSPNEFGVVQAISNDVCDSKKRTLKAFLLGLKHENDNLKRQLAQIKFTDMEPRRVLAELQHSETQTCNDNDLVNEIYRLKGLEERQRLKALGLEVAVQQLTTQVNSYRESDNLKTIDLESYISKVGTLDHKICKLNEVIAVKDSQLEVQRNKIETLQEAIFASKNNEKTHVIDVDERKATNNFIQRQSNSNLMNSSNQVSRLSTTTNGSTPLARSRSGQIFDI